MGLDNSLSSGGATRDRLTDVHDLDDLDVRLLEILRTRPRTPIAEVARRAEVARGTAQARLDRLEHAGVIRGYGPDVDAASIGFGVLAFTTLEIAQGRGDAIADHLASIPEVLEVHAVTGPGDFLCRIVASSNEHLHQVLERVLAAPGIMRTETRLALHTRLDRSVADLITATDASRPSPPFS